MQPITEETFCEPAGFLFKQINPSCKPFVLLRHFPGSFPACQDYRSPEACEVFLLRQKFAVCSWGNKQQPPAPHSSCFTPAPYSRWTFLPEKYFLEKRERFTNAKTVGVPAFTKYLRRLKGVLWLPCSWPSVTQSERHPPSSIETDLPAADDELLRWSAEPFVAGVTRTRGGAVYEPTLLPAATSKTAVTLPLEGGSSHGCPYSLKPEGSRPLPSFTERQFRHSPQPWARSSAPTPQTTPRARRSRPSPASYKLVQLNSTGLTAIFWLRKQQILLSEYQHNTSKSVSE